MMNNFNIKPGNIIIFIFSIIIAMSFAFYNQFPIVFFDTGGYINSGVLKTVPLERPIIYGLFINYTSLGISLWLVVLAQAIITVFILNEFFKLLQRKNSIIYTFSTITLLSFTSGLSFNVGVLTPDIFTPLSIVLLFILLFGSYSTYKKLLFSILYIIFLITHLSNLVIALISIILILIIYIYCNIRSNQKIMNMKNLILSLCLIVSSFPILSGIHFAYGGIFTLSKSSYPFLIARMAHNGILHSFLEYKCEEQIDIYKLCEYKNNLPKSSSEFLWDKESPIYKTGGWEANNDEYKSIFYNTLTSPKFLSMHLIESVKITFSQLYNFEIDGKVDFGPKALDSYSSIIIKSYFYHEYHSFLSSRQQRGNMEFDDVNSRQLMLVVLSFIILILFYSSKNLWNSLRPIEKYSAIYIPLLIFVNAFVTGTLSGVHDRYENRVVWLVPMLVFYLIVINFREISQLLIKFYNSYEK